MGDMPVAMQKAATGDRRVDDRHKGEGLFILFEGVAAEVIDISIGGLKFRRSADSSFQCGRRFSFQLTSRDDGFDVLGKGIGVIRAIDDEWVAVEFIRPTLPLLRTVSRHIGRLLVGRSHLFKRLGTD
jgi:hypothetical protein